jgi:hypothetical protein
VYEIECPDEYRETPDLAHTSWTAGVMSEICGQSPLWLGVIAFTGTVTTRYQAPVPVRERLIGRVTFEGPRGTEDLRERGTHVVRYGDRTRDGEDDHDCCRDAQPRRAFWRPLTAPQLPRWHRCDRAICARAWPTKPGLRCPRRTP